MNLSPPQVVIPDHVSNVFFKQFANTYSYSTDAEAIPMLLEALATPPLPMTPMEQYALSWEAVRSQRRACTCSSQPLCFGFSSARVYFARL
eukprot:4995614-Pleurochrysis_carterae.AAC.2